MITLPLHAFAGVEGEGNDKLRVPLPSPLLMWTPSGDTDRRRPSCFQMSSSDSGNSSELHSLVSYRSCSSSRCSAQRQTRSMLSYSKTHTTGRAMRIMYGELFHVE